MDIFPPFRGPSWSPFRSSPGSPLCDNCQLLTTPPEERKTRPGLTLWVEWEPLSLLVASAEHGCPLCQIFHQALLQSHNPLRKRHLTNDISARYISPDTISLTWNEPTILLSLHPHTPTPFIPPPTFLTPTQTSFLTHRLQTCLTSPLHPCTPPPPLPSSLPARLLHIQPPLITLTPHPGTPTPYTALSYSWGPPSLLAARPPLTATRTTLPALTAGIPIASLPLTLRQAVELSVSVLDIPHIWIDSMCIIQDSPRDWETEAAKMGEVYRQAAVTIIAAGSTSCHSGFLPGGRGSEFEIPVGDVVVKGRPASWSGYHKGGYTMDGDPVDKRGWTYQEELLASRHVKVTGDDVQWRCGAGGDCLCGEGPMRTVVTQWGNNWEFELSRWSLVVLSFSKREFTVEGDRLVALAGVARRVNDELKQNGVESPAYMAGLWGFRLVESLCWTTDSWDKEKRSAAKYIAPSWSWVSVFGFVHFPLFRDGNLLLVEVMSVEVERVGEDDEFGRVESGKLVLTGPVFDCVCGTDAEGRQTINADGRDNGRGLNVEVWELEVSFDCPLSTVEPSDGCRTTHRCLGESCVLGKDQDSRHNALGPRPDGETGTQEGPASMLVLGRFLQTYIALLLGRTPGQDGFHRLGTVMMEAVEGYDPLASESPEFNEKATVVIY
ncbi:heterokaryon incompatibility protein-domain-containing protein [Podospora conica]|nr:heterokaryon incompatibility protein-domain-containing protein [Schizothecium conicum]